MKTKSTPEQVVKELDKVIAVWQANETLNLGPEVTLKKIQDTRKQLDGCLTTLKDLERQTTDQADQRDDCAKIGREFVVRARKGVYSVFGADSTQYAQAGGKRSSDHKKPVRQPKKVDFTKAA